MNRESLVDFCKFHRTVNMGLAVKKETVHYCPFCGSNIITHIGNDAFVCGLTDIEEEAKLKIDYKAARCNRSFRIQKNTNVLISGLNSGEFRRAIGKRVSDLRNLDVNKLDHIFKPLFLKIFRK